VERDSGRHVANELTRIAIVMVYLMASDPNLRGIALSPALIA
jgi:hypothetical protein